jgi:hypothetical protein
MQDQNQTPYRVKYRATMGLFSSFFTKPLSDFNISNEDWLNMLYHEKEKAILNWHGIGYNISISGIETIEP